MTLKKIVDMQQDPAPLILVDRPVPEPGPGELRIKVSACGVCHTELDEIEGRTPAPRLPVVPGHQVVDRIDKLGPHVDDRQQGERVGVACCILPAVIVNGVVGSRRTSALIFVLQAVISMVILLKICWLRRLLFTPSLRLSQRQKSRPCSVLAPLLTDLSGLPTCSKGHHSG